jgi:hypothetical protein
MAVDPEKDSEGDQPQNSTPELKRAKRAHGTPHAILANQGTPKKLNFFLYYISLIFYVHVPAVEARRRAAVSP